MLVWFQSGGIAALGELELFERLTNEAFSDTPGELVGSRVWGMAKVLGKVSREHGCTPLCCRSFVAAWSC